MLHNVMVNDKINALMLMMVDPDGHQHVIPCWAGTRVRTAFSDKDAALQGAVPHVEWRAA